MKPRLRLRTNGTLYQWRPGPGRPFWLIYGCIDRGVAYVIARSKYPD